ncbi:MAG: hypothetical protein JHC33_08695 [Ignisphaera sp.]|nr:hypothetical protein [Ignisphaera sp.]
MKKQLFDPVLWYKKRILGEQKFISRFIRYWGEVDINGVKALEVRSYYFTNLANFHVIPNKPCNNDGATPDRMPWPCHRERKLLEHLRAWETVRDVDKKGMDEGWLHINPSKAVDMVDSILVDNINTFVNLVKDANGRIELSITIPKGANFVDGSVYEPSDALVIPGIDNKSTVEESVFELDANGNIVQEEIFITNPDGTKSSYQPKKYQNKVITEKVPSYIEARDFLKNNFKDIWANRLVIGERVDRKYKTQEIEDKLKPFDKDPFEELLARHAIFLLTSDKVRITDIGSKILNYEAPAKKNENGFVIPIYEFIGGGSALLGDNGNLRYSLPAYTITMIIRNPGNLVTTSGIGKQISDDCKIDYLTEYKDNAGDGYNYKLYGFLIEGRLNGFYSKRSLSNYYWTPDLSKQNVLSNIYDNWQEDSNPDWWVYDSNGYKHLKVDVLKTGKYIKKRKERVALIQSLIDSDYSKENGGVLSIIIVIAAVVLSVLSSGVLAPALEGMAMMYAVAAAIGIFSVILSIASFGLDAMGMYGDANWINKFNKTIQPLVIVASLLLAFKAIADVLANSLISASTMTIDQLTSNLVDWVKDKVINISFDDFVKVINKGFDVYSSNQLKSLEGSVNEKQERAQKMMESKEQSKYSFLAKDMANAMFSPLAMLGSDYQFDRPYEPIFGEFNLGCSCRTTVLALMNDGTTTYVNKIV